MAKDDLVAELDERIARRDVSGELLVRCRDEIERNAEVVREFTKLHDAFEELGRKRDRLLGENRDLQETFRHTHVAARPGQAYPIPGYPDKCQECGLDIRNEIHTRTRALDESDTPE